MFIFQCRLSQLAACLCRQDCSKKIIMVVWICWINTMTIQSYKRVFVSLELWCQHHLGIGDTWNPLLFGSRYSSFMMSPTIKLYRPNSQLFGTDSSAATATCESHNLFQEQFKVTFSLSGLDLCPKFVCICDMLFATIQVHQYTASLGGLYQFAFCSEHFR